MAAIYTAGTGIVVLAGWAAGAFSRAGVGAAYVSMKPNTAACFALAGASLWLHAEAARGGLGALAKACAAAVCAVGGLTGAEYVLGVPLGIDELLFRDLPDSGAHPGRMAPAAAANFVVLGTALAAAGTEKRRMVEAVQVLAVTAALVGLLGLLGYLYAVPMLQRSLSYAMALPTSLAFVAGSLGTLALRADRGLVSVLVSESAGGASARRLLPWVVAAPVVIGWAALAGLRAGLYDVHLGLAWMVFGSVVVFSIVVWANAYESQEARRRSEARVKSVLDAALDAVIMMDEQGRVTSWNARAEALFGWSRDEAVGRILAEMIIPPRHREAHTAGLKRFLATGEGPAIGRRIEVAGLRRDGSEFPVELTITVLEERGAHRFNAFVADITERKRREEALRAAERRLHHVISSSPAVLYSLRFDDGVLVPTWVGENIQRLLGYTAAEVSGSEWWAARLHPEDRERVMAQVPALLSQGHVTREYRFRHKDGGFRWVRDEQVLIEDEEGRREVVGSWSDITARKEAEGRLYESEEQYRLLFENNPHPMWVFDQESLAFLAVNDAAVRHYGYSPEEFLGMTVLDLRPPEEAARFKEEYAAHAAQRSTASYRSRRPWKHRKKDGTIVDMDISGSPLLFEGRKARLILATDVTEKRSLEAQLLQSQKIESMGRLAGGIAHDFNNLLGVISGYGELLRRRVAADPRLGRYVEDITKAADRAAGLTRQLLAFSRKQVLQPRILDLNEVVGETEKMLRRLIGEDVQLVTVFEEQLGSVRADPGQMDQVLMNLAVNARDAMPRGGRLTIETGNVVLDRTFAHQHPGVEPGPYVMLAVSDTGHGMSPEVLARLFEPFFTTKEAGKGTGLGLATVHGIVKQSGGHVWVYSEPGKGATFKIYLPRVDGPGTPVEAPAGAGELPRGTETILLVEDEASLRELVRECLEGGGYTVLPARHGAEALEIAERHGGCLQLLMTDVVMPGMSGRELAERLRARRPDVRILYMSGYTDDAVVLHGVLAADMAFLQKPFTADALARTVREVLDRSAGHPA